MDDDEVEDKKSKVQRDSDDGVYNSDTIRYSNASDYDDYQPGDSMG